MPNCARGAARRGEGERPRPALCRRIPRLSVPQCGLAQGNPQLE